MFAVFETGGKQYRVTEGDVVFIERLAGEAGDDARFDKILACSDEAGTEFGRPYLDGASVETKILGHGKDKKIIVFKYKPKKGYRKKQGHRQPYTKVRVERIISGKFGEAPSIIEADSETDADTIADAIADNDVMATAETEAVDTGDLAIEDAATE